MAGYSGTPLIHKRSASSRDTASSCAINRRRFSNLGPMPDGAQHTTVLSGKAQSGAQEEFPFARGQAGSGRHVVNLLAEEASGMPTDLTEDVVRGNRPRVWAGGVKICAIDETWSALKFVIRTKDRSAANSSGIRAREGKGKKE